MTEDLLNRISSDQLEAKDIPRSRADWSEFSAFALRFEPMVIETIGYGEQLADLNKASQVDGGKLAREIAEHKRIQEVSRPPNHREFPRRETQSVQSKGICSTSSVYHWWTLIDVVY